MSRTTFTRRRVHISDVIHPQRQSLFTLTQHDLRCPSPRKVVSDVAPESSQTFAPKLKSRQKDPRGALPSHVHQESPQRSSISSLKRHKSRLVPVPDDVQPQEIRRVRTSHAKPLTKKFLLDTIKKYYVQSEQHSEGMRLPADRLLTQVHEQLRASKRPHKKRRLSSDKPKLEYKPTALLPSLKKAIHEGVASTFAKSQNMNL